MVNVSANFKEAMTQPVKELKAFINYDDQVISDVDDLISFKVSCDSGLTQAAMRKLEATFLGTHSLLGKWVECGFSVRLPDGTFEPLNFGSFLVTEFTTSKDTGTTNIVAYDRMVNAMVPYFATEIEYPINLYDYTKNLCACCGLELGNVYFGNNLLRNITSYAWRDNANGVAEVGEDYIKVVMPETPTEYSGVYATDVKDSLITVKDDSTSLAGRKVTYSFYAKADAERIIMFQSAGEEGYHYINLTTEWQRFYYVVDNFEYVSPTFYCGNTLDKTPFYIKDIMVEETSVLTEYKAFNTINDWQVQGELWANIDGITFRDIFEKIAQVTGSTCIIGADNKVYFKPVTDTGEVLTYDNLFKLKLENIYGEINSVVLARSFNDNSASNEGDEESGAKSEDIVYLSDEASIEANGLTEFKIENNEIVDYDRESAITPIFDALSGLSFYPFEATTEGLGWYEIGDSVTLREPINDEEYKEYKTTVFNYSIAIDGSVKETLKASAETKTQSQYQYATTISKQIKNTEIRVDKQNQKITSVVSDLEDVNEKYSSLEQTLEGFTFSVQNGVGTNLLKNSVMFAYDDKGTPQNWELQGSGTITIGSDAESLTCGCISGHSFTLNGKLANQTISVTPSTDNTHSAYTLSFRVKKGLAGECFVFVLNDVGEIEERVELVDGQSANYEEYSITFKPNFQTYKIQFGSNFGCEATFTDCMLTVGENKSQWTQASGEFMNTQVVINEDGVTVKSAQYQGNYTVMTPFEFEGYSNVDGTPTKLFSVNCDVTTITKLKANEIEVAPIKLVPITEGDIQGLAFVPC